MKTGLCVGARRLVSWQRPCGRLARRNNAAWRDLPSILNDAAYCCAGMTPHLAAGCKASAGPQCNSDIGHDQNTVNCNTSKTTLSRAVAPAVVVAAAVAAVAAVVGDCATIQFACATIQFWLKNSLCNNTAFMDCLCWCIF